MPKHGLHLIPPLQYAIDFLEDFSVNLLFPLVIILVAILFIAAFILYM